MDAARGRPAAGATQPHVLIGGLGVGFSLAQAAADPRWGADHGGGARAGHHRLAPRRPARRLLGAGPRRPPHGIVEADLITYVNDDVRHVRRPLPRHRQRPRLDRHRGQRRSLLTGRTDKLHRAVDPGRGTGGVVRPAVSGISKKPCGMPGSDRCVPTRSRLPGAFPTSCTSPSDLESRGAVTPRTLLAWRRSFKRQSQACTGMRMPAPVNTDHPRIPRATQGRAMEQTHTSHNGDDSDPGRAAPGPGGRGRPDDRRGHRGPAARRGLPRADRGRRPGGRGHRPGLAARPAGAGHHAARLRRPGGVPPGAGRSARCRC